MKIKGKILLPTIIIFILSFVIILALSIYRRISDAEAGLNNFREVIYQDHRGKLKDLVETAYSQLVLFHTEYKNGNIPLHQAQREAFNSVKHMKYGGNNYFWINDREPKMIMHPNYSRGQKPE